MARHVAAIVNPVSGRQNMLPVVREIGRSLERNGATMETWVTERGGQATEYAASASSRADVVLVVGGDGTVCEVVNGLIDCPRPMVILRTGTENLLARELQMPTEINDLVLTLLFGKAFPLDVGVVNDRRFIAVTGAGFDAECVQRMSRIRGGHITRGDYFWPIWRTFWAHSFPTLVVEADGECVYEGQGFSLVGVIGLYSAGLRLLSLAKCDDGLLDLCVFPCASRARLLRHACNAFLRRHIGRCGVIYRQCRKVRISSPQRVPIEVDGDVGGHLPLQCSLLSGAASFLKLSRNAN